MGEECRDGMHIYWNFFRPTNVSRTYASRVSQGQETLQTIPWDGMLHIVDRN